MKRGKNVLSILMPNIMHSIEWHEGKPSLSRWCMMFYEMR